MNPQATNTPTRTWNGTSSPTIPCVIVGCVVFGPAWSYSFGLR